MRATAADAALEELLEASETLLFARLARDGTVTAANAVLQAWAGRDLTGGSVLELVSAPQRPALQQALQSAGPAWSRLTLGLDDLTPRPATDRRVLLRRAGDEVLFVAEPALAEHDRLVEQVLELNEDLIAAQRSLSRRQRELERAQAEASAATDRVRRLESIMLTGLTRPDLEGVLQSLLEIARDVFRSDRAAVLLRHEEGRDLRVAAATGLDMEATRDVRVPFGRGFAGSIAATGHGRVVEDIHKADIWSHYLRARGGSIAGVPLVLEGEVIGVLHVSSVEEHRFSAEDLALLELVGERAALAIGHAQLRERERAVAEILQRSMLPEALPETPGVALTARYLSRAYGVHVGGDFYDAVEVRDGRVALAIGDVAGKGLQAASAMGRLRNSLRAYAVDGASPAELLTRLDRLVSGDEAMATAQCLLLDPARRELRYANAGHPPALRLAPGGGAEFLRGALAPPLGAAWPERPEAVVTLQPGERVLLYTDGLVERRDRSLDWGLGALARVAEAAAGDSLEDLCERVIVELGSGEEGFLDDVALLAVELEN